MIYSKRIFVTGTDTDIGKTMITACLAKYSLNQGLSTCIYKPVQTGVSAFEEGDAYWCKNALSLPENLHVESTYCYKAPVAPSLAEKLEGNTISVTAIHKRYTELCKLYDAVIVEGAGGTLCPINDNTLMADLIKRLELPAILVSRKTLGTLNHTLCAVESLLHRNVPIAKVIIHEAHRLPTEISNALPVKHCVSELKNHLKNIEIEETTHLARVTEIAW